MILSLLHLVGLWSRVYCTLLVCDLEFTTPLPTLGGEQDPLAPPPLNTPMDIKCQ